MIGFSVLGASLVFFVLKMNPSRLHTACTVLQGGDVQINIYAYWNVYSLNFANPV